MLLITDTEWNYIIIIKKYTFRKKKLGSDLGDGIVVFAQEWRSIYGSPQ